MKRIYFICLVLLLCCNKIFGQRIFNIKGTIFTQTDSIINGVNVFIKDKPGIGIKVENNGKFDIKVTKGDVIVFSSIGFERYEYLALDPMQNLKIVLKEDVHSMDEVVVEAFGVASRKITSTGAVTSVDVGALQVPATSMSSILGGRVAGVIGLQQSGEPGKNLSEFWIRGIGTFGANSSALVLIDGLEGNINSLDPADIESFSVLKDASATAMYGVRGANGVVIVTTKRGKSEKLNIDFRTNLTYSQLTKKPKYLRAYDYAKLANEARLVRGEDLIYTDYELDVINYGLDRDFYPDVNWQKEVLKNSSTQQTYYGSARGGSSVARYFLSLNGSLESAIYKQDPNSKYFNNVGYNTYGFRANIDLNLTQNTKIYFGSDGYLSKNYLPGAANTDFLWYAQSQLTPLLIPIVYSDGRLPSYAGVTDQVSPYVLLNYTGNQTINRYSTNYTIRLDQDFSKLIPGLKGDIQGAFSSNTTFAETRYIIPELWRLDYRLPNGDLAGARQTFRQNTQYSKAEDQYRKYFMQANLNYSKVVGQHNLGSIVHYEMSDMKTSSKAINGMEAIPIRYLGLSSKVSYSYADTYLLNFNFGYTGSENFQAGKRFGFFPSLSAGWVPSSYQWVKETVPWINYFKIRGSYGFVGNDRITDKRFPYLTQINTNAMTGWGYGGMGIEEEIIGADNLKWEKSRKMDLGFEGKLFKHVDYVIDIFSDVRDGIFQQRKQVPDYIGLVNMPYGNVGSMTSFGSDGSISYSKQVNKDFSYIVRANYTYSKNKVNYFEEADTKFEYYSKSGRPYGYQVGYIDLGLFKDEQDIANSPLQTFGSVMPGDIKYKDVNGDGIVNSDDKVALSYSNYPRMMYGLGFEFMYKKFGLGLLFKGTGNTDYYHVYEGGANNMGYIPFYGQQLGNVLEILNDPVNRWVPRDYDDLSIPMELRENPNALFPRLSYGDNSNNSRTSTFWKGNSRYIRLQELNLNYNLSPRFLKVIGMNSLNLSIVGSNVFVWDTVKLWDPEQAALNGRAYPIPRRFTFQAYFKF